MIDELNNMLFNMRQQDTDRQRLPPFLYHGTSSRYLDQILRDGLRPESSYRKYICYTSDIKIATHYAKCMQEFDSCAVDHDKDIDSIEPSPLVFKAIMFKIPIDQFDIKSFCVDINGLDALGEDWPIKDKWCHDMENEQEFHDRGASYLVDWRYVLPRTQYIANKVVVPVKKEFILEV